MTAKPQIRDWSRVNSFAPRWRGKAVVVMVKTDLCQTVPFSSCGECRPSRPHPSNVARFVENSTRRKSTGIRRKSLTVERQSDWPERLAESGDFFTEDQLVRHINDHGARIIRRGYPAVFLRAEANFLGKLIALPRISLLYSPPLSSSSLSLCLFLSTFL